MPNWWNTDMSAAGQTMFLDPATATQMATTPDRLLMTADQQKEQGKLAEDQKTGWWKSTLSGFGSFLGKQDAIMSRIPGWGITKNFLEATLYPIDKTADAARWAYSEAFSQPVATLFLQAAKEDMDVGSFWSGWSDSYAKAENLSPGQVIQNYEMTSAATGDYGALSLLTDNVEAPDFASRITGDNWKYTGNLNEDERNEVRKNTERFLWDKDFWQKKDADTYNKGSGALDFYFVVFGDPVNAVGGGAFKAVKAARSAEFVDDGLGLVRTRGNFVDTATRLLPGDKGAPQTAEEFFTQDKNMNKFYDWVASPGMIGERKSAAEIASHPIWGRGRRVNPFASQFGEVLSTMPRDDMNQVLRFAAGDSRAMSELAAKSNDTVIKLGKLAENRVMTSSTKMDEEFLSYFAAKEDAFPGTPVPHEGTQLFEPPSPRPTTPGPRQSGWDARWGDLQAKADLHAAAAKEIRGGLPGGIRPVAPVGGVNADDMVRANQWKAAQLQLIDEELKVLAREDSTYAALLGWNAGKSEGEIEAAGSNLFGTLDRAYRMGGLGTRDVSIGAERNFMNKTVDRRGRFATQGYRRGFYGTPTRFVQSFGDRVPEGRINHTDTDAADRVLDMLKQVPGLGPEARASLLNRYITAGDKVAKSKELEKINTEIVHHIAGRVHGLDPEVAQVLSEMTTVGINDTLNKLTKGNYHQTKQAFSAAAREGSEQPTTGHVLNGEKWELSPLAVTQLDSTDTLLPIMELNRTIARASGSMKTLRNAGMSAIDVGRQIGDVVNPIWKAATLLRPGYVPRMISEEWMASAIKFGFMSRLLADPTIGGKNFVLNRGQQLLAVSGFGSYSPTTGKGLASSLARVDIHGEDIAPKIETYRKELKARIASETDPLVKSQLEAEQANLKVRRIKVNKALPIVQTRLSMERELRDNLKRDIDGWQAELKKVEGSQVQTDQLKAEAYKLKIANAQDDILDHDNVISEFSDYSQAILQSAIEGSGRRLGEATFTHEGKEIPQAFSKEWQNPIGRDQVSSDNAIHSLYARGENIDTGRAVRTGSWTVIGPEKPEHMESWLRSLNFQFRQDDLFRLVAEDPTGKKASAWLRTPVGKNHLRDLGPRAQDPKQLINDVAFTLDKYLPVPALQQKLAKGEEITAAELAANISKTDFPAVHGEEIKYLTRMFAKDASESIVDRMIAGGFKRLGAIPSDLMSRHPVYNRFFEARMKTLLGQDAAYKQSIGKSKEFTPDELERMKDKADKLARKDMSQIVYDPNRTTGGEAARFIFPFFNAHADGLARWAGLMGEKPQYAGKLAKMYNAPVSGNMVTDQYGNVLDSDGTVTIKDPKTGEFIEKHKVRIQDRILQLRLPWKDGTEGNVPIKMSAINTILPGDPWFHPGSGPIVQVPASQIAKAEPSVGEFLQWSKILPYGPQDTTTAFTPKYMRAVYDRYKAGDPDGEAYQSAYLAVYNRKVAEYHETGAKFSTKDVENEAKAFLNLELLTSWASPAQTQSTPITGSKYQFYVDEYKKMQEVYGADSKDAFLEKYGKDYYQFSSALTKSMGIAATQSADAMAKKYQDLLEQDPDMAPFIIGNVYNSGAFDPAVYRKQLEQSFGSEWVREKTTAKNAIESNQQDLGWKQWNGASMQLDALLIRAGYRSYSEKGAERFAEAKTMVQQAIAAKYPAWGEEYMVTDRGKVPNRIEAFERLTRDERLLSDPLRSDVKMLRLYLDKRAQYQALLRSRGAKQLSYNVAEEAIGKNADIARAWDAEVTQMINSNTQFNQLYNRYLSNDKLQ